VRIKISITLPEELLRAVDQRAKQQGTTRSNFIEAAMRASLARLTQNEQNVRDLEIINRNADVLNTEARDVLAYQPLPSGEDNHSSFSEASDE
jgi:metal-responsive CopG/Arc/MetJ family transcriptional regulator